MKRIAFALGLVAMTAAAVPLAAQSRNDGPWWDPANTGTRTGSTARGDTRNGRVYDDGRIYDSRNDTRRADGRWRAERRDRRGNVIYVRMRYDGNGNLIRERATRDRLGRYRVIDRDVLRSANRRHDRHDRDDGWYDQDGRRRNDRWAQNDGHDNGKHTGWYKDKNKGQGKAKGKGRR